MFKTLKKILHLNEKILFELKFSILPYHYVGGIIYLFNLKIRPEIKYWTYRNYSFGIKHETKFVTSLDCLRAIINSYLTNKNEKNLFLIYNILHTNRLIKIGNSSCQMPDFQTKEIRLLYNKKLKPIYKEMQKTLFQFDKNQLDSVEYHGEVKLNLNYLYEILK